LLTHRERLERISSAGGTPAVADSQPILPDAADAAQATAAETASAGGTPTVAHGEPILASVGSRYLQLESLTALLQDFAKHGITSKERRLPWALSAAGPCSGKGALAYLLRNRIYLGEIRHQGRTYPGEQEPIVERDLFEAVQTALSR